MNILSKGVIADTSAKTIKTNTNSNMRSGDGSDVMPRPRDPRRDKAFRLWEESGGGSKKLKDKCSSFFFKQFQNNFECHMIAFG